MNNQTDKIKLVLEADKFPKILARYSTDKIKDIAAEMALKQYSERPVTAEMMYSCLANLESDLAGMFA